jgi:hypothetical protein
MFSNVCADLAFAIAILSTDGPVKIDFEYTLVYVSIIYETVILHVVIGSGNWSSISREEGAGVAQSV